MKHTKGRFSIRKHPFIITFIIMAVIAVVVAVGYIDVNHRFPEPEEEIVEKNEWIQNPAKQGRQVIVPLECGADYTREHFCQKNSFT